MKLIGIIYQNIKNYQKTLSENLKIKLIGIISSNQKLSENFIKEFKNKVNW